MQRPSNEKAQQNVAPLSANLMQLKMLSMRRQHRAQFEAPACIGEMSIDGARHMQMDRSQAKYICDRFDQNDAVNGLHLDLSVNYETFVNKSRDEGLVHLLQWIVATAKDECVLKKVVNADFVTRKGTMSRLAISPYDLNGVGIKVVCLKYKGVIFIYECETEEKKRSEANRNPYVQLMGYGGLKFEQYVTSNRRGGPPVPTSQPIDNHYEFAGVFKATIQGNHPTKAFKLLYRAEIDAISPSTGEIVEIKTQFKEIGHGKYFGDKALKWWIQATLCGIKHLCVGLHTKDHRDHPIVHCVQKCSVASLQHKYGSWDGAICMQFLHAFLDHVKCTLDAKEEKEEGCVLVAERLPGVDCFSFKLISPQDVRAYREYKGIIITDEFRAHQWE